MAWLSLTLSFQGHGVQKDELLDEGGRVGLIEKTFDQVATPLHCVPVRAES